MRRAGLFVLLMLVVPSIAAPQTKSKPTGKGRQTKSRSANAEQSVNDAQHQWAEVFKNRDRVALNRILDDWFVFTDDERQCFNKGQYIDAAIRAIQVESYSLEDTVIVHYTGTLENGTKFDSSLDRGQLFTFPIGMVA